MVTRDDDPYAVLGVRPSDSSDEIKKKYYKLCQQYHPDVNSSSTVAKEKMARINAAYDLLCSDDAQSRMKLAFFRQKYQLPGFQYAGQPPAADDPNFSQYWRMVQQQQPRQWYPQNYEKTFVDERVLEDGSRVKIYRTVRGPYGKTTMKFEYIDESSGLFGRRTMQSTFGYDESGRWRKGRVHSGIRGLRPIYRFLLLLAIVYMIFSLAAIFVYEE